MPFKWLEAESFKVKTPLMLLSQTLVTPPIIQEESKLSKTEKFGTLLNQAFGKVFGLKACLRHI